MLIDAAWADAVPPHRRALRRRGPIAARAGADRSAARSMTRDEVGGAQAAARAGGAAGRQHVVRAGDVVAAAPARCSRPTNTVPARVSGAATPSVSQTTCSGAMRSQSAIASAMSRVDDDPAVPCERLRGRAFVGICRSTLRRHRGGEARGRRQQNRARVGVVLGLRDEVRGDPVGAAGRRDDHDLARAGEESRSRSRPTTSAFAAATYALPGPTILSTRGTVAVPYASAAMACAPPSRSSRVDAGLERGQHDRRVGPRADGDDLPHAGDPRRDRGHQQRRRQRIAAARHVAADAIERDHALFDRDAGRGRQPPPARDLPCARRARMFRAASAIAFRTSAGTGRGRACASPRAGHLERSAEPVEPPRDARAARRRRRCRTSSTIARPAARAADRAAAAGRAARPHRASRST